MTEVAMPNVGPNDVLIKIKKAAICGQTSTSGNGMNGPLRQFRSACTSAMSMSAKWSNSARKCVAWRSVTGSQAKATSPCGFCRNLSRWPSSPVPQHGGRRRQPGRRLRRLPGDPAFNAFQDPRRHFDDMAAIFDPYGNARTPPLTYDLVGEDVLITGAGPIGLWPPQLRVTSVHAMSSSRTSTTTAWNSRSNGCYTCGQRH